MALACGEGTTASLTPPPADIQVFAASLSFPNVPIHTASSQTIIIQNVGLGPGSVTIAVPVGPAAPLFTLSAVGTFDLQADQRMSLDVTYAPEQPSSWDSAVFAIETPDLVVISLQGSAIIEGIEFSPLPFNFAYIPCGNSVTDLLHITNIGNVSVDLGSISVVDCGNPPLCSVPSGSGGVLDGGESMVLPITCGPFGCDAGLASDAGLPFTCALASNAGWQVSL
jgi:hypothetical protein